MDLLQRLAQLINPAQSSPQIAPSLQFSDEQNAGSTWTGNAATPFGARIFNPQSQPGLVGLDPAMVQDPRFDYSARVAPTGARQGQLQLIKPQLDDAIRTGFGKAHFTPDLDDRTVAGDMWAVTLGGHSGTSPGDQADPFFVTLSKAIVGNAQQITPDMVQKLKAIMLSLRYPDFRQTHQGPAWLPGVDPNSPPNPGVQN